MRRVANAFLADERQATTLVREVYPQVRNGRMMRDLGAKGPESGFVGERVRVLMVVGTRSAFVILTDYITTRFGVDDVRLAAKSGPLDFRGLRPASEAEAVA